MFVYVTVSSIIIVLGLCYQAFNSGTGHNGKKLPIYFFTLPTFALLFFISAFRGDFTTDYNNYSYLFRLYNRYDFFEIFQVELYQETGYILFNKIIGIFTDNVLYLFISVSLIILLSFYSQFKKHSPYIWLSVLLFVTVGSYYTSFNIMRQIMAVAIVFSGSKYLYERKPLKYFLVVIIASLFHKTALIMIIFYYILNLRLSFKNIITLLVGSIVTMLFLDNIIDVVQSRFYSVYTNESYGMTGMAFTNAVLPIAILVFSLLNATKLKKNITKHRVWFNAVVFYAFFSVLGLKVQMVARLSEFFAPYILLLIPLIFFEMRNDELKVVWMMGLTALLVLYNYVVLSGTGYDPYYFIWDS